MEASDGEERLSRMDRVSFGQPVAKAIAKSQKNPWSVYKRKNGFKTAENPIVARSRVALFDKSC